MKTQEIVVPAHEPVDTGGRRARDEFGIVRVSYFGSGRWRYLDGLDEGEDVIFEQSSYLGVRQLEFRISQHANVFVKDGGGYDGPKTAGLPG